MPLPDFVTLESRAVLKVCGEEAELFLQNIFTNDIRKISEDVLQFNLLLTPQGMVLHDVFIFSTGDAYFIDCHAPRKDDLIRRLKMFKLRAKVTIEETALHVYASTAQGFDDPRLQGLGKRMYSPDDIQSDDEVSYNDFCIEKGIAISSAIVYERDFAHELNFDVLHAIAWDKGCFIGQEVAARVHHKGLAKKRLMRVDGSDLETGAKIIGAQGQECGQVRSVNTMRNTGLAIVKLSAMEDPLTFTNGTSLQKVYPPAGL